MAKEKDLTCLSLVELCEHSGALIKETGQMLAHVFEVDGMTVSVSPYSPLPFRLLHSYSTPRHKTLKGLLRALANSRGATIC